MRTRVAELDFSDDGLANLPGAGGRGFAFNFYVKQDAIAFGAPLYLNMLCADYGAVMPRVQLTFAPNLGVAPLVTCFDMDPSKKGTDPSALVPRFACVSPLSFQRASIPITGEALRCTPYDAAQSIVFSDVFQLETIEGVNWWHGYLKVDFLDPWDGALYSPPWRG